ncbi:hypothetical protein ACA910_015742 [Epithemia clementina (nom. ined.)]
MSQKVSVVAHYYRRTAPSPSLVLSIQEELRQAGLTDDAAVPLQSIATEQCFNILLVWTQSSSTLSSTTDHSSWMECTSDRTKLEWLLSETFVDPKDNDNDNDNDKPVLLQLEQPFLTNDTNKNNNKSSWLVEFGPRLTFTSAFSSNAVTICHACGCFAPTDTTDGEKNDHGWQIQRLEPSWRYQFTFVDNSNDNSNRNRNTGWSQAAQSMIKVRLHDRMTQQEYTQPLQFGLDSTTPPTLPKPVRIIPILERGRIALEELNVELGLGFDVYDLDYYTHLFQERLGRNPTDVECFDMGQSNSEHSRHWFFGGKLILDGIEMPQTLFQMVKSTLHAGNWENSKIAFHDNSSAIAGYTQTHCALQPTAVDRASSVQFVTSPSDYQLHPLLTAETHNFPTGVAPFPGAETGTGGRLRDVMATGRGAHPVAGLCAYCVGRLLLPGSDALPWETADYNDNENDDHHASFVYPKNLATPLAILLQGSDGTSDYGNKYGEPVLGGFTRSFGQRLSKGGARYEWVKPILFSAGVGQLEDRHVTKGECETGMWIVKIGGPAYRIGIGGGAASSRAITTTTSSNNNSNTKDEEDQYAALDFDAVQRGDAEMGNRLNRFMRACCDLGADNPIVSVHDQGAGGNGNVLKEIVEPAGASYDIRKVLVGDETLSVLELWGAEYQENNAILIRPEHWDLVQAIAQREHCPVAHLGHVTGDGRVVVHDTAPNATVTPVVDLPLDLVLGKMPQKTFVDQHEPMETQPLSLPQDLTVAKALDRVLRLVSVGSKRFLVHKVDRSVTGLCAQQQCVGPLQLPLSNVAVTAHTYFGTTGTAVACGEQPIKGLIDAACMARMTVAEAMTNLMWAKLSSLSHVKASGNWMYAAKLPGEGAKMYDACQALRDALLALNVAIDGGKDSLSMAAKCGDEIVKAPGELVLTCYVTCPDITLTVTPNLERPEQESTLIYVDLGAGHARLGGSALAQVYNQIGTESPDISDFAKLKTCIDVVQQLIQDRKLWAGHDRSDGGLIVTLLEMAISGNCGINVNLPQAATGNTALEVLFAEEAGFVLQVATADAASTIKAFKDEGVTSVVEIGTVTVEPIIKIAIDGTVHLEASTPQLRDIWESTSFALEKRQRNPVCVVQEEKGLKLRKAPEWKLTYEPKATPTSIFDAPVSSKHKVAVLRQEGSNGDREMVAAFIMAGFDAWDVTVSDLLAGNVTLDQFRGIAFVGGFSFADVLDSGKGWAGVIKFNPGLWKQFEEFRNRPDTFSLGVCNGCQLVAILGWVPGLNDVITKETQQPRLLHNESGKFESRFVNVQIQPNSPSVMLKGMEGSSLGVWVAHGEGRFHFPDKAVLDRVEKDHLAPIRYVDDSNTVTMEYPFNPNGSPKGIAALCSPDGRHLALMPHPERVFTAWQWPWMPQDWIEKSFEVGPWLQMFQNARIFCDETK